MSVGLSREPFFGSFFFFHTTSCDAKCLTQRLLPRPNLPLGLATPRFSPDVARYTVDSDPYPNVTWVDPSMVVGESTPDGNGGRPSLGPIAAELYTPSYFAASSSHFSLLSFGNPQFMSTSPPSISSRELPRGSAPEECTVDVLRDSVRSLDVRVKETQSIPSLLAGSRLLRTPPSASM